MTLVVRCPEGLRASVDDYQIHQALLNLVLNAVDALTAEGVSGRAPDATAPRTGTVALTAEPLDGAGVSIAVEDDGPSIPDEVIERIFEPFFTTKDAGTGLGLTIARNVARAHGGDLELAANRPGAVRMEIRLPGCRLDPVSAAAAAAPPSSSA